MTEVEILTSPQMSGSFDAFARTKGKISEESFGHDNDALNFYNARLGQSHLPWYLRPSFTSEILKVDQEGRVKAGTLAALVERLTVDSQCEMTLKLLYTNADKRFSHSGEVARRSVFERFPDDFPKLCFPRIGL